MFIRWILAGVALTALVAASAWGALAVGSTEATVATETPCCVGCECEVDCATQCAAGTCDEACIECCQASGCPICPFANAARAASESPSPAACPGGACHVTADKATAE